MGNASDLFGIDPGFTGDLSSEDFLAEIRSGVDVAGLRADRDRARTIAVALEQECAAKDAAIAEALRWLDMAATYTTSEDAAAAIDDAAAALRAVT